MRASNDIPVPEAPARGRFARIRPPLLFALVAALLASSWMYRDVSVPNERSRVYLAVALVDDLTLSIDGPIRRFGRIVDVARVEGRFYTDKAPGSSLLGAGLYYLVRLFTLPTDWTIEELINLMRSGLMIPVGLLGFALIRRLLRRHRLGDPVIDIASLGWILGTAAFHYSTAYYGHQIAAVALLAALLLLEESADQGRSGPGAALRAIGAGAAAGLAGLTEYQSAFPCVLLAAFACLAKAHRPARIGAFALGALPFAALLGAYNALAFGSPFELSYHHLTLESMKAQHHFGIAGVTWPTGETLFGALLSLHRGLFTTSPIFLLTLPGLFFLWKRSRPQALLIALSVLYYLAFIAGAKVWHGGWGFGLRLFVPVMAWAAIPAACAAERCIGSPILGGLARGLLVAGILYNQIVHAVFPELPDSAKNPLPDLVFPALREGLLSPNLPAALTGRPGLANGALAALLVLLASAFILFRGFPPKFGRLKKALSFAMGLVPSALLAFAIGLAPLSLQEPETREFLGWLKRIERIEYPAGDPDS